jgi:hypothetical protein
MCVSGVGRKKLALAMLTYHATAEVFDANLQMPATRRTFLNKISRLTHYHSPAGGRTSCLCCVRWKPIERKAGNTHYRQIEEFVNYIPPEYTVEKFTRFVCAVNMGIMEKCFC